MIGLEMSEVLGKNLIEGQFVLFSSSQILANNDKNCCGIDPSSNFLYKMQEIEIILDIMSKGSIPNANSSTPYDSMTSKVYSCPLMWFKGALWENSPL
jgi:hypothetical protein